MNYRCLLFISVLISLPYASWTEMRTAASCSFADVNAVLAAASDGDIVSIPAGSATWSSTLEVTKAITIMGAGYTQTVLTAINHNLSMIILQPMSNKAMRVTGIGFIEGQYDVAIVGSKNGSYVLDQVRVDHCSFTNGHSNMLASGWVEGLIDHNYFLNCDRAMLLVGDGAYSWGRTIAAGTSHALFIEDNRFVQTNAGGAGLNENIYHQEAARTVIRNNLFDSSAYTISDAALFDSHGSQGYYTGSGDFRGQPMVEVYNNIFNYDHSYRVCYFRGGSVLFHNNTFNYVTSSTEIVVTEEEGWQASFFPPALRTVWPAQDQINNSFFWNNTRNGIAITDVRLGSVSDTTFIQKGRDYFMNAPASSGGYEYFTGSRQGGSTAHPTESDTGSMAFSGSGANAYYPYTPYTYPHPLQGNEGDTIAAPTRLRLK